MIYKRGKTSKHKCANKVHRADEYCTLFETSEKVLPNIHKGRHIASVLCQINLVVGQFMCNLSLYMKPMHTYLNRLYHQTLFLLHLKKFTTFIELHFCAEFITSSSPLLSIKTFFFVNICYKVNKCMYIFM